MSATTSVEQTIENRVDHLANQAGVLAETLERRNALRALVAVAIAYEALTETTTLAGMGRESQQTMQASLDELLSDCAYRAYGCSALTERALTLQFGLDVSAADYQEWQANRPRS